MGIAEAGPSGTVLPMQRVLHASGSLLWGSAGAVPVVKHRN